MENEAMVFFDLSSRINEEIDDTLMESAFIFCQVDHPLDKETECLLDLDDFKSAQQTDFQSVDVPEVLQLQPEIGSGFCPQEFYLRQNDVFDAYASANMALAYDDWLKDKFRLVFEGTTAESPQTITDFKLGEVIRFIDTNFDSCLRGSIAQIDFLDLVQEFELDPSQTHSLIANYDNDNFQIRACLQTDPMMCIEARIGCERIPGMIPGDDTVELISATNLEFAGGNRLTSEISTSNVIRGLEGDDVLIGRSVADLLDGGAGDDIFYVTPRNSIRVITGEGNDIVVISEDSSNVNELIEIDDLSDQDTIRFYNPDTYMFLDVPFNLARIEVLAKKMITSPMITSLQSPEMYVGIINFGEYLGVICDTLSDFFDDCLVVSLADNNNSVYSP